MRPYVVEWTNTGVLGHETFCRVIPKESWSQADDKNLKSLGHLGVFRNSDLSLDVDSLQYSPMDCGSMDGWKETALFLPVEKHGLWLVVTDAITRHMVRGESSNHMSGVNEYSQEPWWQPKHLTRRAVGVSCMIPGNQHVRSLEQLTFWETDGDKMSVCQSRMQEWHELMLKNLALHDCGVGGYHLLPSLCSQQIKVQIYSVFMQNKMGKRTHWRRVRGGPARTKSGSKRVSVWATKVHNSVWIFASKSQCLVFFNFCKWQCDQSSGRHAGSDFRFPVPGTWTLDPRLRTGALWPEVMTNFRQVNSAAMGLRGEQTLPLTSHSSTAHIKLTKMIGVSESPTKTVSCCRQRALGCAEDLLRFFQWKRH